MCHLLLLMPVLGLPVFWLTPLSFAVPFYIVIISVSGLLYWLIAKSIRQPLQDGFHSLIGTQAEVVSKLSPGHHAQYLVRAEGELWSAHCADVLQPGETVNIAAVNGIRLVVEHGNNVSHPDQLSDVGAKQAGTKAN